MYILIFTRCLLLGAVLMNQVSPASWDESYHEIISLSIKGRLNELYTDIGIKVS